jgi:predicted GTPase
MFVVLMTFFEGEIRKQVELAIDEADVIFVVDVEGSRQWMMLLRDYYVK